MLGIKFVTSPIAAKAKLIQFDGPLFEDLTIYDSKVGILQHLVPTRPNVSFAVNCVC